MNEEAVDAKVRFPVEQGHVMMFARSVGDPNPIYFDEEYAASTEVGGVIAPPTFTCASWHFEPDFPLRPRLGEPWFGSGREPSGVTSTKDETAETVLHAEQHFEY